MQTLGSVAVFVFYRRFRIVCISLTYANYQLFSTIFILSMKFVLKQGRRQHALITLRLLYYN